MHAFLHSIICSFVRSFLHIFIHSFISRRAQRRLLLRGIWWMKRTWQSIIWVLTSTGGGSTVIQWKRPVWSVSRNRAGWLVVGPYDITMTSWWHMGLVSAWPQEIMEHLRKIFIPKRWTKNFVLIPASEIPPILPKMQYRVLATFTVQLKNITNTTVSSQTYLLLNYQVGKTWMLNFNIIIIIYYTSLLNTQRHNCSPQYRNTIT